MQKKQQKKQKTTTPKHVTRSSLSPATILKVAMFATPAVWCLSRVFQFWTILSAQNGTQHFFFLHTFTHSKYKVFRNRNMRIGTRFRLDLLFLTRALCHPLCEKMLPASFVVKSGKILRKYDATKNTAHCSTQRKSTGGCTLGPLL